jgi:hypothetical protein
LANKILEYYLNGKSLCKIETIAPEYKREILIKAVSLINDCFGSSCDIKTHRNIETVFDEIIDLIDRKRLYTHATRATLKDPDLLAMRECLGFFIYNSEYPGFWKREYDIAKYYCVSYSDLRFRLNSESLPRLDDILEFVKKLEKQNLQL